MSASFFLHCSALSSSGSVGRPESQHDLEALRMDVGQSPRGSEKRTAATAPTPCALYCADLRGPSTFVFCVGPYAVRKNPIILAMPPDKITLYYVNNYIINNRVYIYIYIF